MFDSTEKNEKDNGPSMREETVQIIDGLLISTILPNDSIQTPKEAERGMIIHFFHQKRLTIR